MRDLKADLKSIQEGRTLFDDPDPSVGTKYELYEVAEHAIGRAIKAEKALGNETILNGKALAKLNERADKAEALARELVDMLGRVTPRYLEGRLELDLDLVHEANGLLEKAKEVLGDE